MKIHRAIKYVMVCDGSDKSVDMDSCFCNETAYDIL